MMMPNKLGDAIRARRLAVGMSQREMGEAAGGRSVNQMNAYECGRSRPSPPVLAAIAKALGTTPIALLSASDVAPSEESVASLISKLRDAIANALGTNPNTVRVSVDLL
jgi:transcriptional regulator with XRE-family HTH domain